MHRRLPGGRFPPLPPLGWMVAWLGCASSVCPCRGVWPECSAQARWWFLWLWVGSGTKAKAQGLLAGHQRRRPRVLFIFLKASFFFHFPLVRCAFQVKALTMLVGGQQHLCGVAPSFEASSWKLCWMMLMESLPNIAPLRLVLVVVVALLEEFLLLRLPLPYFVHLVWVA